MISKGTFFLRTTFYSNLSNFTLTYIYEVYTSSLIPLPKQFYKIMKNCTVALFSYYLSMSLTTDNSLQIKVIDPLKKTCETFLGNGKPGLSSEEGKVQFDEPGGLCVSPDGQCLYVADTNNQAIRVIDLNTKTVSQVRSSFRLNSVPSFSQMLHWI